MKILHLNFTDLSGGAARAAYRLHCGLRGLGVDSQMLVQYKESDDPTVFTVSRRNTWKRFIQWLEALPLGLYRKQTIVNWNGAWLSSVLASQIKKLNPDIIHLHWVCGGMLSLAALAKLPKHLVWTLHDCWPFTGGCHYPLDCLGYLQSCGCCPQLGSRRQWDLSRWVWQRKARRWQGSDFTVLSPSRWLARCARDSALFQHRRIEVIPNGLDLKRYQPFDPQAARTALGLPQEGKIILCGYHKGFSFLPDTMRLLADRGWRDKARLVIFGASQPTNPPDMTLATHYMGFLKDDISLSLLFAAGDVSLYPSIQDNLPNTVLESLACGTPVVAFHVGGMPDMIDHQENGYLAEVYSQDDLAQGLSWVLEEENRSKVLKDAARSKIKREFEIANVSKKHLSLYKSILSI